MEQSETLLLFFAETNQRQSCSRVPQSSWSLSSTRAEELWVEIAGKRGSRRYSTTSFGENVVIAGTSFQIFEV